MATICQTILWNVFLEWDVQISIEISMKFVPRGQIDNIPSLVQTMTRWRPVDKPLSEPMMDSLLTYMCVTRPQCGAPAKRWYVPLQWQFEHIVQIFLQDKSMQIFLYDERMLDITA